MQQEYCHFLTLEDSANIPLMPPMEDFENSFAQVFDVKQENGWIDQYLLPEAFMEANQKGQEEHTPSQIHHSSHTDPRQEEEVISEETCKRKSSIFHNIHKNLITFMKKIHIRKIDLASQHGGLRAYDLWRIFKECKDYTKKCLYMIFGVGEGFNEKFLRKAAAREPELKILLNKYPLEDLEKAQEILRHQFFLEVSRMPKESIHQMCKMNHFQDFYTYLQSFLTELEGEGLTLRMKKQQKKKILESRDTCHQLSQFHQ